MFREAVARWWQGLDRPGWRNFAVAMALLALALLLALSSAAAAEAGRVWAAGATAIAALALAGWVGVRFVPRLAERTGLAWLRFRVEYRLTREGVVYLLLVLAIALAALNTGNNLLFMLLASLLAGIIVSGILSRIVLTGIELRLDLPEHIFAGQPVGAAVELRNHKRSLPSFSLLVTNDRKAAGEILPRPVYFPHVPRRQAVRQTVELVFPRRGVYRQRTLAASTRFPFGFLEKTRRMELEREVVVYPRVEPTEEFYEVLPLLAGERESYQRGRGHDLYSIREYLPTDSARFVDWKASARTGSLKVREFAREDERRLLLALDPFLPAPPGEKPAAADEEHFERAVTLCACLAWHFHEAGAEMAFRLPGVALGVAPAGEIIYDALRALALVTPQPAAAEGSFLSALAEEELFKIILTSRPRGSIPTRLWTSSYLVFFDSL